MEMTNPFKRTLKIRVKSRINPGNTTLKLKTKQNKKCNKPVEQLISFLSKFKKALQMEKQE